jgi:zinc transport system permease protein
MDDFVLRALAGGIGVALVAGPLGCFVVWRRMAYFGATLAHAALLGIALGFLFEIDLRLGVMFVSIAVSALVVVLERSRRLAADTLLGILAHGALAFGLVCIAFLETVRVDVMAYLFGDILAIDSADILWIYAGGAASLAVLAAIWRRLLSLTVQEDLARVEGVNVTAVRLAFMVVIAVVIAVAMKIVGVLLIVSMLIIPPAIARRFAATPEAMAALAALFGGISVAGGLAASLAWDTPAGPSIVAVATVMFFAVFCAEAPLRLIGR